MAFKKITLTLENEYIVLLSPTIGGHKSDLISFGIAVTSVFDSATISETRGHFDSNNDLDFTHTYPVVDGNGVPLVFSDPQQITRSVADKGIGYIYTLNGVGGLTSIDIIVQDSMNFLVSPTATITQL